MHVSHLCIQIHIRVTCEWKSRAICMCLFCIYTCLVCIYTCRVCVKYVSDPYGVATVSRIDKIIGFFCRIASLLLVSFAKETYNFIDPTNCSHPISILTRGSGYIYVALLHRHVSRLHIHVSFLHTYTCCICIYTCLIRIYTCLFCIYKCLICSIYTCLFYVYTCHICIYTCHICIYTYLYTSVSSASIRVTCAYTSVSSALYMHVSSVYIRVTSAYIRVTSVSTRIYIRVSHPYLYVSHVHIQASHLRYICMSLCVYTCHICIYTCRICIYTHLYTSVSSVSIFSGGSGWRKQRRGAPLVNTFRNWCKFVCMCGSVLQYAAVSSNNDEGRLSLIHTVIGVSLCARVAVCCSVLQCVWGGFD